MVVVVAFRPLPLVAAFLVVVGRSVASKSTSSSVGEEEEVESVAPTCSMITADRPASVRPSRVCCMLPSGHPALALSAYTHIAKKDIPR